ncbi:magnesium chelatase ATPase subunit I [Hyphomonas sp.]|uniref:magnesium chelatase ATPase subunit I n=1 Tax=Hyphomonas sp. TaxID=87 RepID=UPI00391DFF66
MTVYPFTAIVGQAALKDALLLASIDPSIGGVLALGERGTGKSTAIRALAALLPEIEAVNGCPYNCAPDRRASLCEACAGSGPGRVARIPAPVVDLPLGATEDRITGALDLERALSQGEKRFEPGLLARAHRGFLYIDEVNLLEDHLVDLLLDVAASGENVVEREGLSIRHPSRFVLVGSGNPEEGDLRPQLLDRFGLCIDVRSSANLAERVEIVKRRDAYERDPAAFVRSWSRQTLALRKRIVRAREALPGVTMPDEVLEKAVGLCVALGADGLRGELTLMRAARARAALDGETCVTEAILRSVAVPSLRHRLRKDPLDDTDAAIRVERAMEDVLVS